MVAKTSLSLDPSSVTLVKLFDLPTPLFSYRLTSSYTTYFLGSNEEVK